MVSFLRLGVCLCFSLLFCQILTAQEPVYRILNENHGLPSQDIYTISVSSEGYVILGTEIGLVKFNGHEFHLIPSKDLGRRTLSGYVEWQKRGFAYSFYGDVVELINDTAITIITQPSMLSLAGYVELINGPRGLMGLTHNGIYVKEERNWKAISFKDTGNKAFKHPLSLKDTLWCPSNDGVMCLTKNNIAFYELPSISSAHIEPLSYHFVHTSHGVYGISSMHEETYIWDGQSFKANHFPALTQALRGQKVNRIKMLDNKIAILTFDGLYLFDHLQKKGKWYFKGLPLSDLVTDASGTTWMSTIGYGLIAMAPSQIENYNIKKDLNGQDRINQIQWDGQDHLYYARINGIVGNIKISESKNEWIKLNEIADISCLKAFPSRELFVGFNRKLLVFKESGFETYLDSLPSVKDIHQTNNRVYLASSTGLYWIPQTDKKLRSHFNGITRWIRRLVQGKSAEHFWACTSNGLIEFENDTIKRELLKGQVVHEAIWDQNRNRLLACLINGSIYEIEDGKSPQFITSFPPNISINAIEVDGDELILATSEGLIFYNIKTKNEYRLTEVDGLGSKQLFDVVKADSHFWVASSNGLQKIPINWRSKAVNPILLIKKIKHQDNILNPASTTLHLSSLKTLELFADVISLYAQGQYKIGWKIDNQEWEWLPEGQRYLRLGNITPQNASLSLIAVDYKGNRSKVINYQLLVVPPYWQSGWFILLIVLSSVLIVSFIFFRNLKQLRIRQHTQLERMQLEGHLVQSQLTALKAQMNPHFIFNALNSIYELIMFNETKEAAAYLNKFSSLLRKVLENSDKEAITLIEECEWLRLYLNLEKLRFGEDFHFSIQTSDITDLYSHSMPTMLLQPFVENSIKHGLLHKPGYKTLKIIFYEENEHLVCTIQDNGIGREKAAALQKNRTKRHHSFATGAIQQRIEMLNRSKRFNIQLQIHDLKDDELNALGTKIELRIASE